MGGCMTDSNGDSCAWVPGNDGSCPSDTSSSGSSPNYHSYLSAVAVAVGDQLRVAMTGLDDSGAQLETMTVRGGKPTNVTPVLLDGAPLAESILPRLSAIDGRVYFMWRGLETRVHQGAILRDDGSIDPTTITSFEGDDVTLHRVGNRHLAIARTADGTVRGTLIRADGTQAVTVEIAHGIEAEGIAATSDDPDGTAGLCAVAFYRPVTDGRELRVTRITEGGTMLDGDGILIARSTVGSIGVGAVSVATLPDGSTFLTYRLNRSSEYETHTVRIPQVVHAPVDGSAITDRVTADLPVFRQVVARGSHILGISTTYSDPSEHAQAHLLDRDGSVLAGPVPLLVGNMPHAITTPSGFAVLQQNYDISVTYLDDSGRAGRNTPLAETYEIESGCTATGAGGSWLVLVAIPLVWRRRRATPLAA
jgi:hypothetical protein